ncbi:E3 ubiquitin-protein ligase COP1 isoform X1 [Lampetra planeri]
MRTSAMSTASVTGSGSSSGPGSSRQASAGSSAGASASPSGAAGRGTPRGGQRKRPQAPIYNGLVNSYEDKNNDFVCPICFDMIEEAYITKCGHSFCCKCIRRSLEENNRCPKCNYVIENPNQIFPNFLLNELILKQRQRIEEKRMKMEQPSGQHWHTIQELLALDQDGLELADVNRMLELLTQKKMQLEAESTVAQHQLLIEFLQQAHRNKQGQLDQLTKELSVLHGDMRHVEELMQKHHEALVPQVPQLLETPSTSSLVDSDYPFPAFTDSAQAKRLPCHGNNSMAARRKKLSAHFDDLEQCYFSCRLSSPSDENKCGQLEEFQDCLAKFTRYSSVRPLATLSYASDIYNGSSIVSSIEFDRDCDYFAIAGVTKKIKVFEYGTVIRDAVDIHYPVIEMTCNSKISCISWSNYHKGILASSDYEGTVILWDGFTGQRTKVFQEHEKRCWSVDFNLMDPKILASGSDDAKVKLWSTHLDNSVACIEAKANVCCVKFSPTSRYHLAFGCADHCVHYYDLRNTKLPVMVFKGHRKAVSYAKFVSGEEIVSASTDSQLKLWSVNKPHCLRSFKGHINEKNFVGLATNGDYIACGSENNSLYVYYKGLSKMLLTFKFDMVKSVLEKEKKEDDGSEFVSAVCWRVLPDGDSNVLVAANSQGTIKVLELV